MLGECGRRLSRWDAPGDEAWRWYPAQAGVVGTEVAKARGCAHMQTLMYAHS
jgi:hypothetical protein